MTGGKEGSLNEKVETFRRVDVARRQNEGRAEHATVAEAAERRSAVPVGTSACGKPI